MKFLLDENLSYQTAQFLESLGHDAKTVEGCGLASVDDEAIAAYAVKERRTILTLDLDFGEIFYFGTAPALGVIVLKLRDQRIESVNQVLDSLLRSDILARPDMKDSLVIVDEGKIRVRRRV